MTYVYLYFLRARHRLFNNNHTSLKCIVFGYRSTDVPTKARGIAWKPLLPRSQKEYYMRRHPSAIFQQQNGSDYQDEIVNLDSSSDCGDDLRLSLTWPSTYRYCAIGTGFTENCRKSEIRCYCYLDKLTL